MHPLEMQAFLQVRHDESPVLLQELCRNQVVDVADNQPLVLRLILGEVQLVQVDDVLVDRHDVVQVMRGCEAVDRFRHASYDEVLAKKR